jgi:hypothetical protein
MQLPVGVVTTFTEQAEGPLRSGVGTISTPDGHADGPVAAERRFQMLRPVLGLEQPSAAFVGQLVVGAKPGQELDRFERLAHIVVR